MQISFYEKCIHMHTGKKLFLCANRALTAEFQSLSLTQQFCAQKALNLISEHTFFKNFLGGMPSDPLESSCFAFQSVLCTLQVNLHIETSTSSWFPFTKVKIHPCYFIGFAWQIPSTFLQPCLGIINTWHNWLQYGQYVGFGFVTVNFDTLALVSSNAIPNTQQNTEK